MKNSKIVNLNIFILSTVIICFEIISTRISSVIFVQNYAFIILSLAILGLSLGGVYSYYKSPSTNNDEIKLFQTFFYSEISAAASLAFFIFTVINFEITNPIIYFFLLFIPFFFAGIVYSLLFKFYAANGFKLYTFDLIGGAFGSVISIIVFEVFNAPNGVLLLSIILFLSSLCFVLHLNKIRIATSASILLILSILLTINGKNNFLGYVPIGNFPEKDFHYVYEGLSVESNIIESRWSVYGRADLVQYSHQDVVKQIFVDGAAGTPMYKFSGNLKEKDPNLFDLLINQSSSIPFLFLNKEEKNSMLVIGPGGGKEVLVGLLENVDHITGVEINPDFVEIVKDHRNFNGGIYTDFPNVEILVKEGRHFIKQSKTNYDLIVMALPSTEQMQSIEAFAMNENYLLTVEALKDYISILTEEGRLIFTVHNQWELARLIITTIAAFEEIGINSSDAVNHFAILESEFSPTIVIKKNPFSANESLSWRNIIGRLPQSLPRVTYLPHNWNNSIETKVNQILLAAKNGKESLTKYVKDFPFDMSACRDDSPYFYKTTSGIPEDLTLFLAAVAFINFLVVAIPLIRIKKGIKRNKLKTVMLPLIIFICIGLGFMILEISMFQKLILYLGSPTISLSILLCSILIGMGIGSFFGKNISKHNSHKRLKVISLFIVITGSILFILLPFVLDKLLAQSLTIRALVTIISILPFGFLLGIPFPSALQLLKEANGDEYVPWMYGVNGTMSVLSSILVVSLSMITGFTPTFFIGLFFYFVVFIVLRFTKFGANN